ncbi:hypothetical protein [Streptobacillus moniliformis]|uniref:hypothetical protein n=1 Tax=Streptobacillus moniliformis TaxID=34105 RepID=UPI0007E48673|nr:hypothetical protein [Streptobacillus moniliformis]
MKKNDKKLVVCKKEKKEVNVLKNTITHTINNLEYSAKLMKIADNYFIFVSSENTLEENKFIFYYALEYFANNTKDTIVNFELDKENINIYVKVMSLFKNRNFKSCKLNKMVGDLNEK